MANEFNVKQGIDDPTVSDLDAKAAAAKKADLEAKAKKKKKQEEEAKKPKPKYYYDVKIECMLPATLTYRILAETPEQAADLIKGQQPNGVVHKLIGRKEIALRVYSAGSSMMHFMRKLFG